MPNQPTTAKRRIIHSTTVSSGVRLAPELADLRELIDSLESSHDLPPGRVRITDLALEKGHWAGSRIRLTVEHTEVIDPADDEEQADA